MRKIYQLASCVAKSDAVSNMILAMSDFFNDQKISTQIFSTFCDPSLSIPHIKPITEFLPHLADDKALIINHYSIFDSSAEYFLESQGKKVLIYHNITPHHFFTGYNDKIAEICQKGREFLPNFRHKIDLAIALSDYSRNELIQCGFPAAKVISLPYFIDLEKNFKYPNPSPLPSPSPKQILFVGKIAPHKKIEDLIKAFFLYQKYFQPDSQLNLVGTLGGDLYEAELKALAAKLAISNKVIFHGKVPDHTLEKHYQTADIFITLSEHEGFCVPLIEAMRYQIPIIAYQSSAIPETLGESGIQFPKKSFGHIAQAMHTITENPKIRSKIIETQNQQLQKFNFANTAQNYMKVLSPLLKLEN